MFCIGFNAKAVLSSYIYFDVLRNMTISSYQRTPRGGRMTRAVHNLRYTESNVILLKTQISLKSTEIFLVKFSENCPERHVIKLRYQVYGRPFVRRPG